MTKLTKLKLSELRSDEQNANLGTERGSQMIEHSISRFGFVDAGVIDENNVIIGGNKRASAAEKLGMEEVDIVDVDGTRPVYLRVKGMRLDDPDDPRARELAFALNRTAQVSLRWDPIKTREAESSGLNLSAFFNPDELPHLSFGKKTKKERDGEPQSIPDAYMIIIECPSEQAQVEMLTKLASDGIKARALVGG